MTLSRFLPPSTSRRLLREAGPPQLWIVLAIIGAAVVLGGAVVAEGGMRTALLLLAVAITVLPSVLDRTGWRVYLGIAWLGAEQRRRLGGVRPPRTPAGADRWLKRPEAPTTGLVQATALMMAGRWADARALVTGYEPVEVEDPARIARMLAAIDGMETGHVDPTAAVAAIAALPVELRRYHELSLAWSTAWVASHHHRPWRAAFARAAAGITTDGIPPRFLVFGVFQELLLPIIAVALLLIARLIGLL